MKTAYCVFHTGSDKANMVSCIGFFSVSYIFSLYLASLWVESILGSTDFELSRDHYFDQWVVNMCEQNPSGKHTGAQSLNTWMGIIKTSPAFIPCCESLSSKWACPSNQIWQ